MPSAPIVATAVHANAMPQAAQAGYAAAMPPPAPQAVQYATDAEEITRQASISFLAENGWPSGLIQCITDGLKTMPYRFMILDDSGSMGAYDGMVMHKVRNGPPKMIKCSRWTELAAAMTFHGKFANVAKAPTEFRFLNNGAPVVVGEGEDDGQALRFFENRLEQGPSGGTPLVRHIHEVATKIRHMTPELRARGQRVSLTIATDGQSSDGDVAQALKQLIGLPVWTVIRLCTDEENVVDYWNNIDNNIELEMDVLDDLSGECQEVMGMNDWLTYGEPLHRLREFGCHKKEMDMVDEALLSPDMMRGIMAILFGGNTRDYPHPEVDFEGLVEIIQEKMGREPTVWSPKTKKLVPWINVRNLKKRYSKGGCVVS